MKSRRKRKAGFSLLEIIIVLGIIALLAGIGVSMMTGVFGDAEETKAKTDVTTLQTSLMRYKIKGGIYPSEQQGLMALVRRPEGQPQPTSWKPYLKNEKHIIDPWGTPYQYKYPGVHNKDTYDIFTHGPDKQLGTEDDIGNW